MIIVHVICEGQTEETFVRDVLQSHFNQRNIYLETKLIGGTVHPHKLKKYIRNLLKTATAYCTTFYDFYGLPHDFFGKPEADTLDKRNIQGKANAIYSALHKELEEFLPDKQALDRFIPYVQMYEFEALLFSHTEKFALGIGEASLASDFQKIRQAFDTPEHINDSQTTAPSKRIIKCYSGYQKELQGNLGALEIGLSTIRQECHLFDEWLQKLEALQPI